MTFLNQKIPLTLITLLLGLTVTAQTQIPAVISNGARWTAAGSPYIMSSNVLIESTGIIIIEPGTVVQADSTNFKITVDGELQAIGTGDSIIKFDMVKFDFSLKSVGYDPISGRGSQFQYCEFDETGTDRGIITLFLGNTPMLVKYCKFIDGGENIRYSSSDTVGLFVEKSVFIGVSNMDGCPIISTSSAKMRMSDCYAENMRAMTLTKDAEIRNCTFINFYGGIVSSYVYNSIVLECNLFKNFRRTSILYLPNPAVGAKIKISHNTFDSSQNHIQVHGDNLAKTATFIVENNNFLAYSQYSVSISSWPTTGGAEKFNFRNNWWGTTNTNDIAEGILDFNDDSTIQIIVDFGGHLTQEVTTCKNGDPIGQADTSRSTGSTSVPVISNFASNVYPNPATNQLNINLLGNPGKIARILDFSGKLNLETTLTSDVSIIDISHLPNGLYLLEIAGGGIIVRHKVIVSR